MVVGLSSRQPLQKVGCGGDLQRMWTVVEGGHKVVLDELANVLSLIILQEAKLTAEAHPSDGTGQI